MAVGAPWIKISDFEETTLWISVVNTTTNLALPKESHVEITEISDNGMTLKLPGPSVLLVTFSLSPYGKLATMLFQIHKCILMKLP